MYIDDLDAIAKYTVALVEIPAEKKGERGAIFHALGSLYKKTGKLNESIIAFLKSIELCPLVEDFWIDFAKGIKDVVFSRANPGIRDAIIECFSKPFLDYQTLATPALSLLKLAPFYGTKEPAILQDHLLHLLLTYTIIADSDFEKWMTHLRRELLFSPDEKLLPFAKALREQCIFNEFLYLETKEEEDYVQKLVENFSSLSPFELAILGSYRPIEATKKQLAPQVPLLRPIQDETSKNVRLQYEENPYPKWKSLNKEKPKKIIDVLKTLFPHRPIKDKFSHNPEILVAGCGTGQEALNAAMKFENCRVLGLDLSANALRYACLKKEEMGLSNVQFVQGDLLNVGDLKETFDIVECAGVLHHMRNPLAGWEALRSVLKPNGIMVISLYSKTARQDVFLGREYIKKKGYKAILKDIRQCRQELVLDKTFETLVQSIDFYTVSACRDLLFHVEEHPFSLLEIEEALKNLKLKVIGIELPHSELLEDYMRHFPDDTSATSLHNWDLFEKTNPQTFIGMVHLWLEPLIETF